MGYGWRQGDQEGINWLYSLIQNQVSRSDAFPPILVKLSAADCKDPVTDPSRL